MLYSDIQTQFLGLLNRRDCTTTQVQGFIQNSILRIQRELRVPLMEKVTFVTVDSTYATAGRLAIPSDFLELIDLIATSSQGSATNMQRMEKCDISRALLLAATTGVPAQYSRDGTVWVLGPQPVVGDVIKIKYYASLPALVNPTDTNPFTINAYDLLLYGALTFAGDFYTDKRVATWEARYTQIRDDMQSQADMDEESGAAAVQPAFAYPDDLGNDLFPYPTPGGF
jgi:hypothetical protein